MTISTDIRLFIRNRERFCCAYCGVSETSVGGEIELADGQLLGLRQRGGLVVTLNL